MGDIVFIEGLQVDTIIGVYDWEREVIQRLSFDLRLTFDCRAAAETDDVKLALNYAAVADTVTDFVQKQRFLLIETVAEQLVNLLFAQFACDYICLTVRKPGAVATAEAVGIQIERARPS